MTDNHLLQEIEQRRGVIRREIERLTNEIALLRKRDDILTNTVQLLRMDDIRYVGQEDLPTVAAVETEAKSAPPLLNDLKSVSAKSEAELETRKAKQAEQPTETKVPSTKRSTRQSGERHTWTAEEKKSLESAVLDHISQHRSGDVVLIRDVVNAVSPSHPVLTRMSYKTCRFYVSPILQKLAHIVHQQQGGYRID